MFDDIKFDKDKYLILLNNLHISRATLFFALFLL